MKVYFKRISCVIFLMTLTSVSYSNESSRWNTALKNTYIQQCKVHALEKSLPLYETVFNGKMQPSEYTAFIQSISQEMADNCHCIITQASRNFSPKEFIEQSENVSELASSLSQPGAECAPDMNAMINRIESHMGISN